MVQHKHLGSLHTCHSYEHIAPINSDIDLLIIQTVHLTSFNTLVIKVSSNQAVLSGVLDILSCLSFDQPDLGCDLLLIPFQLSEE